MEYKLVCSNGEVITFTPIILENNTIDFHKRMKEELMRGEMTSHNKRLIDYHSKCIVQEQERLSCLFRENYREGGVLHD